MVVVVFNVLASFERFAILNSGAAPSTVADFMRFVGWLPQARESPSNRLQMPTLVEVAHRMAFCLAIKRILQHIRAQLLDRLVSRDGRRLGAARFVSFKRA